MNCECTQFGHGRIAASVAPFVGPDRSLMPLRWTFTALWRRYLTGSSLAKCFCCIFIHPCTNLPLCFERQRFNIISVSGVSSQSHTSGCLGDFWALLAQCYWWEVVISKKAMAIQHCSEARRTTRRKLKNSDLVVNFHRTYVSNPAMQQKDLARLLPARSLHLSAVNVHRSGVKELSGPTKGATETACRLVPEGRNGGKVELIPSSGNDTYTWK